MSAAAPTAAPPAAPSAKPTGPPSKPIRLPTTVAPIVASGSVSSVLTTDTSPSCRLTSTHSPRTPTSPCSLRLSSVSAAVYAFDSSSKITTTIRSMVLSHYVTYGCQAVRALQAPDSTAWSNGSPQLS